MFTLKITPGEGGADAQAFAQQLSDVISKTTGVYNNQDCL